MRLTDNNKAVYLLLHTPGIGKGKCRKILDSVKNISNILKDIGSLKCELVQILSEKEYFALCETAADTDFTQIEEKLERYNTRVITVLDPEYPQSLYKVEDMPLLLYARGDVGLLKKDCFAVVGTRYPTRYGVRVTEDFVSRLAERFTIVSGLARGVDAIAQREALKTGGTTIGVLGCGVDIVYPMENADLIGLELTRDVHRVMFPDLKCDKTPSPLLGRLIEKGSTGMKAGQGLRAWTPEQAQEVHARLAAHLIRMTRD